MAPSGSFRINAKGSKPRNQVLNRIGIGGIIGFVGALGMFAVEQQTEASNRTIGGNNLDQINSASLSDGKRCGMSPEEFARYYPPLIGWIRSTLAATARKANTVASLGFPRLPLYFTGSTLASAKIVLVDPLPRPPLTSMGLSRFVDFERGDFDGITYMDTFFVKPTHSRDENMHFHELVHVVQWRLLGPERFLFSYANGLECFGYRQSPLEVLAYDAEAAFASSTAVFDVEKMIAEKLGL
jgi:hypothetical protein